jgi:hypothetical protein
MHRATRLMFGTVGIGLLAAFLVLGLAGSTVFTSGTASPAREGGISLATAPSHGAPVAAVHPDAPNATSLTVTVTGTPRPYSYLPTAVNFSIAVTVVNNTFTVSTTNTNGTLFLVNELTEATFVSIPVPIANGTNDYSMPLNWVTLGCASATTCAATLGTIAYSVRLYVAVDATADNGTTANTDGMGAVASVAFISYTPNFGGFGGTNVTAGNISVTVVYSAQYVTLVTLNIYNSTGILVFTSTFANNATTGAPQTKVWYEATSGVYTTSVVGSTPFATFYTNASVTVVPASSSGGGTVYQNTTVWTNTSGGTSATGYFGLSAPVSGTLFLLIGLIVGILAALVAARMMMSEPPSKPAQPWTDKKGGDATNTCSVCGKSFGSADELAAHAKSEHGM